MLCVYDSDKRENENLSLIPFEKKKNLYKNKHFYLSFSVDNAHLEEKWQLTNKKQQKKSTIHFYHCKKKNYVL
jgi:hypothetical protein